MKLEQLFEMYTAYVLSKSSRKELIKKFPPRYSETVGHHVTLKFGVPKDTTTPSIPKKIEIVGIADTTDGLEALIVAINGKTERPDGSTYHITWSLDRSAGYKPVDSNKLVKKGYTKVGPISITVTSELLK